MNENSKSCTPTQSGTVLNQSAREEGQKFLASNSGSAAQPLSDSRGRLNPKLRTPLNGILGFAELLEGEPLTTTSAEYVKHIRENARELLEIINCELTESDEASEDAEAANATPTAQYDVLYIEDDPVNLTLVQRILDHRPALKLMHAAQGEIGVKLACVHKPKLILLDLNLPDIHGSEVLRRLRAEPTSAAIPVVVVSADATPSQIERLLSAGARNYLTKPLSIRPFLAVVDEIMRAEVSDVITPA